MSQFHHSFITVIIDRYGLDPEDHQIDPIVVSWLQEYDSTWIVQAIIESVFRGRYKIKSVDNILKDWQRLSEPRYQFTPEYEREILDSIPTVIELPAPLVVDPTLPLPDTDLPESRAAVPNSKYLNPEESEPFHLYHHLMPVVQPIDASLEPIGGEEAGQILVKSQPPTVVSIHHQPVKLQLFNRLQTIIDPNHHQKVAVQKSVSDSTNTKDHLPCIPNFQLPIELEL